MFISYSFCYLISLNIFFCGLFGCFIVKRNLLVLLICIELILISVQLNFLIAAYNFNDVVGQIFNLFILMIAAAEVAVGLAFLILNYRLRVQSKRSLFICQRIVMYLISVCFPILSLIIVSLLLFGFLTPGYSLISIFISLGLSLLFSVYGLYEVVYLNATCTVECTPWFEFGTLRITWSFLFDKFNTIIFFLVISISLCVHVFALVYLADDPHLPRFIVLLYFFTVFMQILVTAGNFMQLFVGWEGVGLISYLLINFWFTRYEASNSGLMAIIYNRIGDCDLFYLYV